MTTNRPAYAKFVAALKIAQRGGQSHSVDPVALGL